MKNHKFTLIIPTRERADTLFWALKTCIIQDYENLDILVSDNFSQDKTKEVVHSFNDPRIKYINPDKRLSMPSHWEFAVSHVKDGFVSILGDDDGYLPNTCHNVNNIINFTNVEAVSSKLDTYAWPSHLFEKRRNHLTVSLEKGLEVLDTKVMLNKVASYKEGYARLPSIYKGFTSIEVINNAKKISKRLFLTIAPDIFSNFAIASVIEKYVYSFEPLSISGSSGHSSGGAHFAPNKNQDSMNKYKKEIFSDSTQIPKHFYPSNTILIADCFNKAQEVGLLDGFQIDPLFMIREAMKEVANTSSMNSYEEVKAGVIEIANSNNISPILVKNIIDAFPLKSQTALTEIRPIFGYNSFRKRIDINTLDYNVTNVYDAALLDYDIRNNPTKYISKFDTLSTSYKLLVREFKRRTNI